MEKREGCSKLIIDAGQFDELEELCLKLRLIREMSLVRKVFSEWNTEASEQSVCRTHQQQEFSFWFRRAYLMTYREQEEMNLISGIAKKFWKGLNSDITPAFRNLIDQMKAVYDPHLEPVVVGGMIIDWVDVRTGERPWFS